MMLSSISGIILTISFLNIGDRFLSLSVTYIGNTKVNMQTLTYVFLSSYN